MGGGRGEEGGARQTPERRGSGSDVRVVRVGSAPVSGRKGGPARYTRQELVALGRFEEDRKTFKPWSHAFGRRFASPEYIWNIG